MRPYANTIKKWSYDPSTKGRLFLMLETKFWPEQDPLLPKTPPIMIMRFSLAVCWGRTAWVTAICQWFLILETLFRSGQGPVLPTTPPIMILRVKLVVGWGVIYWVTTIILDLIQHPIVVCFIQWIMMIMRKDKIMMVPWVISLIN